MNFRLNQNIESEKRTWENFRKGNPQALEDIFKQNFPVLFDYGMRISNQEELIKDCIQDIFVYLWEKRENLSSVNSVRAYLISSFRRLVLKTLKKHSKKIQPLETIKKDQIPRSTSFEDLLVLEEDFQLKKGQLYKAIEDIPERMREALYLKTFQELSYNEIASIMDIRPQVARNYVFEAFKRLRQMLKLPAL